GSASRLPVPRPSRSRSRKPSGDSAPRSAATLRVATATPPTGTAIPPPMPADSTASKRPSASTRAVVAATAAEPTPPTSTTTASVTGGSVPRARRIACRSASTAVTTRTLGRPRKLTTPPPHHDRHNFPEVVAIVVLLLVVEVERGVGAGRLVEVVSGRGVRLGLDEHTGRAGPGGPSGRGRVRVRIAVPPPRPPLAGLPAGREVDGDRLPAACPLPRAASLRLPGCRPGRVLRRRCAPQPLLTQPSGYEHRPGQPEREEHRQHAEPEPPVERDQAQRSAGHPGEHEQRLGVRERAG